MSFIPSCAAASPLNTVLSWALVFARNSLFAASSSRDIAGESLMRADFDRTAADNVGRVLPDGFSCSDVVMVLGTLSEAE